MPLFCLCVRVVLRIRSLPQWFGKKVTALLLVLFAVLTSATAQAQVSACPFNVRGVASAQATQDGLLITRFARGLRGSALVASTGATAEPVEAFIQTNRDRLDLDGNGHVDEIDASIITRVLAGLPPVTASNIALRAGGSRSNATAIRQFLDAGCLALNVRLQGLALGNSLQMAHGSNTITATLNDTYSFPLQGAAGSVVDLRILAQPQGQICAPTLSSPDTVPTDNRPIFMVCVHQTAAKVTLPDTVPNAPLSVSFGLREKAYASMPYESRPGVVGGIFPYEYRVTGYSVNGQSASSSGISLDFRRGTVRFTPQTQGTHVLTMEIRDSGATQKTLTQSFTINVGVSGFLFVAPNGIDSVGRGQLGLPFKTVAFALTQSQPTDVIMLRRGTYLTGAFLLNDARAKQLLAYPDEVVTLDLNRAGAIGIGISSTPSVRLEGFDITNVQQWGIVSDPSPSGIIVRNTRFLYGVSINNGENPGFIHGWGDGAAAWRHKFLVQDSDFGTYVGPGYSATLFDAGETLFENNQMRLGDIATGGIHDKDNSQNNVYRENYVEFSNANRTGYGIRISAQSNSADVHIHHNLLVNGGIMLGGQCFNELGCYMRNHDIHHNTIANESVVISAWGPFNSTSFGSRASNNIISSRTSAAYTGISCSARPGNLNTAFDTRANLIETTNALAFKDSECTGNDMTWAVWQGTYGFDTTASGSTISATTSLIGAGPLTGLPTSDVRIGTRGHQYAR